MSASSTPRVFDPYTVPLTPGVRLVEASAGTGKTYNIVLLVIRLLIAEREDGTPLVDGIGKILVVTFTIAATSELVSRIRAALRIAHDVFSGVNTENTDETRPFIEMQRSASPRAAARLHEALGAVDRLSVFTIHGFCKRVLDEFALESGAPFGATLVEDQAPLIQGALEDWWRRTFYVNDAFAALAVRHEWTLKQCAKDYTTWSSLPEMRIDPDIGIDHAAGAFVDAVAQLRTMWRESDATQFLATVSWKKGAPLAEPTSMAAFLASATAASMGDLSSAIEYSAVASTNALQEFVGKQGNAKKAVYNAVPAQPFVQAADAIAAALAQLELALRADCLRAVRAATEQEKSRRNLMGFDDLLVRLRDALTEGTSDGLLAQLIREQYQAALIDEFQDTDPYQFPIFNTAFTGCPLFLIGDPKQAIYSFRGADIYAYLDAARNATETYSLDKNWRSTSDMVSAVNALFAQRRSAFLHREIHFTPMKAAKRDVSPLPKSSRNALHWLVVEPDFTGKPLSKGLATDRVLAAFCNEIVSLCDRGVAPGRIAVLVRAAFEGVKMERALRDLGIPAVVSGMGDILSANETVELHTVLMAIADVRNEPLLRAALATDLWGETNESLRHLCSPDGAAEWQTVLDSMAALREVWVTEGVMPLIQRIMSDRRVLERLLPFSDGERRLTNYRHIIELVHSAASEQGLNIEGVLRWLNDMRTRESEDRRLTELRLESDADAVKIVTIHSSKGLEYDVVFCPTLWTTRRAKANDAIVAHLGDDGVVFDHGSPDRVVRGVLNNLERLEEDLRLTYVALTRAKYRTYVAFGPIKTGTTPDASWYSALAYLLFGHAADGVDRDTLAILADAGFQPTTVNDWRPALEALVAEHRDSMSLSVLGEAAQDDDEFDDDEVGDESDDESDAVRELRARTERPAREQFDTWSVASYTTLSAGSTTEVARDIDDAPALSAPRVEPANRGDFASFPKGARAGVALHELFERASFTASREELLLDVTHTLTRAGLATSETDARVTAVATMMTRVLDAPIGDWPFSLRSVRNERTLREWEFLLPLGDISRYTMAETFARHGGALGARYAPLLRKLNVRRVHGFLTGFVDLVFEHDGRWYIVDWKSHQLGSQQSAYTQGALTEHMDASHHTLQYHLYATALHRYLKQRVPGYTFETHMGGVAYAYLRGFTDEGAGWYVDRPSEALIEALSALMDAGRATKIGSAA